MTDRQIAGIRALAECLARAEAPVDGPEIDPTWVGPDAPCQGTTGRESADTAAGEITLDLEIRIHDRWHSVDPWIFRSWAGERRRNGAPYSGPVYLLGTDRIAA